jgi:hypothetical protein
MLRLVLRLLRVDLNDRLAQIRTQVEEFQARTTHQVIEQVKETRWVVGFALVGAVVVVAPFCHCSCGVLSVGGRL